MSRLIPANLFSLAVLALVAGCGSGNADPKTEVPVIDGSKYILSEEPQGVVDVIAAREAAADADQIVVVGRIGGKVDPWIKGRVAFTLVDMSLKGCAEDGCKTPWDYCCKIDQLPASTVLVQFVDEKGNKLKADARATLKLMEFQTVVVRGKAQRNDAGMLQSILADGVFVRK